MKKSIYILLVLIFSSRFLYSYNWEYIKGPNSLQSISALEVFENSIYIAIYDKLFKSDDLGETWIEIRNNDNLPFNYYINSIIKTEFELFVQSAYKTQGPFEQLSLSKDGGFSWVKTNKDLNPMYYYWITQNKFGIYSAFQAKINNKNQTKLMKYNSGKDLWEDFIDSLSYKKITNTPKSILNKVEKVLIGTRISQYGGEVIKRPNIFVYSPNEKIIASILDTISGIWKSHINCFAEKDEILYAGTSTGIYKSTDEGYHWELKSEGLHYKDSTQDWYYEIHRMMVFEGIIYAIATQPTSAGNFYPTYTNIVYSIDNGENWKFASNFQKEWPQDFRIMNDKIILSTYNGLFQTDKTLSTKVSLINDTLHSGDVPDFWVVNDTLIASKFNNFLFETENNGNNWKIMNYDSLLYNSTIHEMYIKDGLYYICGNYQNFFISKDYGKTYRYVKEYDELSNTKIRSILVDSNDVIYLGTMSGVYFSTNQGDNWQKLTPSEMNIPIMSIEKVEDFLFLGTVDYGIYKMDLKDKSVTHLNIPKKYTDITVNEIKYIKGKLYIGTRINPNSSKGITVYGEGIFVSQDLGNTWEKRNTGLPDSCQTISIVSYGDFIFAGLSWYGSVYYSSDEGMNWYPLNRGYSGYTLNKLRVFGDYLYCATSTGLYKLNLKEWINGVDEVERKNYLYNYPPYPNPATDEVSATIYWDLALDINLADIKIYDVYGNQIADKTSTTIEEQGPYYGKLTWHCKGVPPGVYLVNINYGTEKKTIKVCVVE